MRDDKSPDEIEPAAIGLGVVFALLVIIAILRLL